MSQSELHKYLVETAASAIKKRHQGIITTVDLQLQPGDELPPIIHGFRPDLYARDSKAKLIIIAEAKTDNDVVKEHTYQQVTSFISYLERHEKGKFILAVTGIAADSAKTLLRFVCRELNVKSTDIEVFDCCDFWFIEPNGWVEWHLI